MREHDTRRWCCASESTLRVAQAKTRAGTEQHSRYSRRLPAHRPLSIKRHSDSVWRSEGSFQMLGVRIFVQLRFGVLADVGSCADEYEFGSSLLAAGPIDEYGPCGCKNSWPRWWVGQRRGQ